MCFRPSFASVEPMFNTIPSTLGTHSSPKPQVTIKHQCEQRESDHVNKNAACAPANTGTKVLVMKNRKNTQRRCYSSVKAERGGVAYYACISFHAMTTISHRPTSMATNSKKACRLSFWGLPVTSNSSGMTPTVAIYRKPPAVKGITSPLH